MTYSPNNVILVFEINADVAELVDALVLGTSTYGVGVRVPSSAVAISGVNFAVNVDEFFSLTHTCGFMFYLSFRLNKLLVYPNHYFTKENLLICIPLFNFLEIIFYAHIHSP